MARSKPDNLPEELDIFLKEAQLVGVQVHDIWANDKGQEFVSGEEFNDRFMGWAGLCLDKGYRNLRGHLHLHLYVGHGSEPMLTIRDDNPFTGGPPVAYSDWDAALAHLARKIRERAV